VSRLLQNALAALLTLSGLALFMFGNAWAPAVLAFLPDSPVGYWLELVVPFIPMLFIGGGALVFARFGKQAG
jgi:hypothetical protein